MLGRIKEVAKELEGLNHLEEQSLIDQHISSLLGLDIDQYRKNPRNYRVYHGHLADLAGVVTDTPPSCEADASGLVSCQFVQGINLSGWNTADFLPLRISYLFWLTMSLVNEEISKRKLPKFSYQFTNTQRTELIQRCAKEICVELETLRVARLVAKLEKHYASAIKEAIAMEEEDPDELINLLQKIRNVLDFSTNKMLRIIQGLEPEEEVSYSSGSINHCVYVSFRRVSNHVLIRVDNAGLWSEDNSYHLPAVIGGISGIYPSCIATVNFTSIEQNPEPLKKYLSDILIASLLPADKAKDMIYNLNLVKAYQYGETEEFSTSRLLELSKQFTPKVQQTVGNCVVASHNIGMEIRINQNSEVAEQEPFTWIKRQETRTSATADPQIGII
ncbi:hypothetical protein [Candidatus Protochlamydia amoebophila]|nr:hypothetical protein [Candidatus Protochlamydia amoebophila]